MEATIQERKMNQPTPESVDGSRGRGLSEPLLLEDCRVRQDMRLAARAIKRRWDLPDDKKQCVTQRLFDILEKKTATVATKFRLESVDSIADANAIAAARILVDIEGQNQADELPASKNNVNVNVGVNLAQQYQERVAGRDYDELCAEIREEAAAVIRQLDESKGHHHVDADAGRSS